MCSREVDRMIRHQNRNDSVEIFVLVVAAVAIMVGLELDVIRPIHLAFITGNYTMYSYGVLRRRGASERSAVRKSRVPRPWRSIDGQATCGARVRW